MTFKWDRGVIDQKSGPSNGFWGPVIEKIVSEQRSLEIIPIKTRCYGTTFSGVQVKFGEESIIIAYQDYGFINAISKLVLGE